MTMTADDILRMTRRDAVSRFAANGDKEVAALIRSWHPDICDHKKSNDVFRHLVFLRKSLRATRGGKPVQRVLRMQDGKKLGVSPLNTLQADQGEIIVNRNTLGTIFPQTLSRLAAREVETITSFRFANVHMEKQMAFSLPNFLRADTLADGSTIVIVQKAPQEILLSDLLRAEGRMPDVHAAWLCSGLMNITAWLSYVGIMHGAISPEHILVDPAGHSVRLAAGWAFTTRVGARPTVLPSGTLGLIPRLSHRGQLAETIYDRALVRQVMRDALGDPHGTNGGVLSLPAPIATWINLPPAEDAVTDYEQWQMALEQGWGKRRFVKYDMDARDIYHEI